MKDFSHKPPPNPGQLGSNAFAYSISAGGASFVVLPLGTILSDVYARYFGLSFQQMASVFFANSLIITASIPIIGILSDKSREHGGTRKLWVIVALICMTAAGYQLMVPPKSVTSLYFCFWLVALRLSQVAYDIAHLAWGSELARSYNESTRLFSLRCIVSAIGAISFFAIPLLPVFKTTEITPEVLQLTAVIAIIYMIPAIYYTVRHIPDGEYHPSSIKEKVGDTIRVVLSNKPFLTLVSITMLLSVGEGMWCSLSFIVYDYYYGIGKDLSAIYVLTYALTAVSLPFIEKLCAITSKKRTYATLQVIFISLITLPIFLQPGKGAYIPLCVVMVGVQTILTCNFLVANAILVDSIDYGLWKYRIGHGGSYFAANNFFGGIAGAMGGPLGLSIIGHFGFSSNGITNFDDARIGVDIAFFMVPVAMSSIAVIFITRLPICARRSAIIRRRLEGVARLVRTDSPSR